MEETLVVRIAWAVMYVAIACVSVYAYSVVQTAIEIVAIMFMTGAAVWMSYANRLDNVANPIRRVPTR